MVWQGQLKLQVPLALTAKRVGLNHWWMRLEPQDFDIHYCK